MLRTIRARLYGLVGLALAAFVVLSIHAASVAWKARRDAELSANLEVARTVAAALRAFVDDVVHQAAALGRAVAEPRLDRDARNRLLAAAAAEYAAVHEFDWVTADGVVAASSNPSSIGLAIGERDYLRRVAAGEDVVVSDLLQPKLDGEPVVVVARGVRAGGEGPLLGTLVAFIAPERLGLRALPVAREGDATLGVFDRASRAVFRWPEPAVFDWAARQPAEPQPLVDAALAGRDATGPVLAAAGDERLGAAVAVPGIGWVVQASRSKAEAMAPLRRELLVVMGAGLLLSIVALVASGAVGARTVAGLRRLERRAVALARGEKPAPAGRREPEEIARLGRAYEAMAGELLAEQERFRTVFDAAPAGIAVIDAETHEARWANRAYLAFLDEPWRTQGIAGVRADAFLPRAAEHGILDVLRRVAAGEAAHDDAELQYDGFERGPTWWRWSVRAVQGARPELVLMVTEVTEQVRARQQVEAERRRLEALLQTLPAGVFISDARGQLVQANDEARRIWGGRAPLRTGMHAQYRGRRVDTGAPLQAGDWPARRALATGAPVAPFLVEIDRFDGARATILTGAMPTRDASGAVNGAVATLLDVTELRKAVRHRDEVLRVVSHDLRTPLATVTLGAAALLRTPDLAADGGAPVRRAATRIATAGKRMTRLIEDLLDMASLDEGHLSMRPEPVDPADLIGEAAEELRALAEERGLDLCLSLAPGLPPVACDRDRILQVLGNVAGNAVKATERGAICLAAEPFGDAVVFRVRDTGPGIPAEELPHVFDRYHRGADAAWIGTGLGLAISRALVEAHGGTIWADSVPGEGTTITFTLPVTPAAALAQAAGA